MRYLLIVIFSIFSCKSISQVRNYPIQTIFKGDSVVIMSTDQFQSLNVLIETQRSINQEHRDKMVTLENEVDSLRRICQERTSTVDSLKSIVESRDSVYIKLRTIESWLYESAVGNSYIYYSWKDLTIKRVDLSAYAVYGNKINGKLSFHRRGPNDEIREWRLCNFTYPQEPELNWEMKYSEDIRPIVTNFPYKFKNNLLQ